MEPLESDARDGTRVPSRRGWWLLLASGGVVLLLLVFWAVAAVALWPGWWGALWVVVLLGYLAVVPWALLRRYRKVVRR